MATQEWWIYAAARAALQDAQDMVTERDAAVAAAYVAWLRTDEGQAWHAGQITPDRDACGYRVGRDRCAQPPASSGGWCDAHGCVALNASHMRCGRRASYGSLCGSHYRAPAEQVLTVHGLQPWLALVGERVTR